MIKLFFLLTLFVFTLNANVLRVGYSTDSFNELSKKDSQIALNLWFEEMIESIDYSAKFTFYDNVTLMSNDFDAGKLDLIFANGIELVKYFDTSKMRGAITGGTREKGGDNLVEVRRKSTSLEVLKRQKVLKVSLLKGETPSNIYVKGVVAQKYKNKKIVYVETKKYTPALLKLFFKQVDIAIIPKKTFEFAKELNPQIGVKLEITHETDITLATLGCFRKDIDKKFSDKIIRLAFEKVKDKRGKQMLIMLKIPKLERVDLTQLTPIKKLYKEYLEQEEANR